MKQHFFSAALVVVTLLAFAVGGYALTTDVITSNNDTSQCQTECSQCPNPGSGQCCGQSCDKMSKEQCETMKAACGAEATKAQTANCAGQRSCGK